MRPMVSLQRSIVPSNLLPSWPRSDKRSVCEPCVLMWYRQDFFLVASQLVLFSPNQGKSAPLHQSNIKSSKTICDWNLEITFLVPAIRGNKKFRQGAKMWTNNLPPGRRTWHPSWTKNDCEPKSTRFQPSKESQCADLLPTQHLQNLFVFLLSDSLWT